VRVFQITVLAGFPFQKGAEVANSVQKGGCSVAFKNMGKGDVL
jgi:hypothetical protein